MDNISLTKLIASPISKMTWSQLQRINQLRPIKKDLHGSSFISDPGPSYLKSTTATNQSSVEKHLSKCLPKACANGLSTSTNHSFWNKLTTCDRHQLEVPSQLYAPKTEVEPVLVEGVGWAGQPIVRRTHPILPEGYGDLSDIFTAVEKLPVGSKARHDEEAVLFSQTNGVNKATVDSVQLQTLNSEVKEGSTKSAKPEEDLLVSTNKTKKEKKVKRRAKSSDAIQTFVDENIKMGPLKTLQPTQTHLIPTMKVGINTGKSNGGVKRKTGGETLTQVVFGSKEDKRLKKLKNKHLKSGLVLTKQKRKSKKKFKVGHSKAYIPLKLKTKIKTSKGTTLSRPTFGDNQKLPNILLSQRVSAQPVRKNCFVLANRQIQTYSQANQAKVSLNVKERTSTTIVALGKKLNKSSKIEPAFKYPEDCKCPEVLETKSRFPTKICGEAAGGQKGKKKMKEYKGKMCPLEEKVNHRKRTFVCSSAKFGKAKRKRQLPKCVKPEKLIAPRVLVCPPALEDEKMKKEKKCVKVEEVKIRLRTKVCKPIIIYQNEESSAVVQKAVCVEKVKKTISRHTTICSTSKTEKIGKPKKAMR